MSPAYTAPAAALVLPVSPHSRFWRRQGRHRRRAPGTPAMPPRLRRSVAGAASRAKVPWRMLPSVWAWRCWSCCCSTRRWASSAGKPHKALTSAQSGRPVGQRSGWRHRCAAHRFAAVIGKPEQPAGDAGAGGAAAGAAARAARLRLRVPATAPELAGIGADWRGPGRGDAGRLCRRCRCLCIWRRCWQRPGQRCPRWPRRQRRLQRGPAQVDATALPVPLDALLQQGASLAKLAQVGVQLGPQLPWLLGIDEPRHYIVIVQNNHELRATVASSRRSA